MKGEYGGVYLAEYDYLNVFFVIKDKEQICRFIYDNDLFNVLFGLRMKVFETFDENDNIDFAISVKDRDEDGKIKAIVVSVIDTFITLQMAIEQIRKIRKWFDKEYPNLSELVTLAVVGKKTTEK